MNIAIAIFLFSAALAVLLFWYFVTEDDTVKRWVGTGLSIGSTVFCLVGIVPVQQWGNLFSGQPVKTALLPGIDIAGGSSFGLQLQMAEGQEIGPQTVEQAIGVIRERLNALGAKDLSVAPRGQDQIILQMPGVKEEERASVREQLQKAAKLDFHLVHPQSAMLLPQVKAGEFIPGYKLLVRKEKDKKGNLIGEEELLVTSRPDLRGTFVDSAHAVNDPTRGWVTIVGFSTEGRQMFADLTRNHVGEQLAVVLDGVAVSAPRINEPITQGSAEISGMGTGKAATELASALQNPLEAPLKIIEERSVSPTLGAGAVKQGVVSGIAGLLMVTLFMVWYYRLAGLIALVGLVVNMVLLFGIMAMFQFTFTLPGIAGIILTIGMAVDSNVLIYERLKEELAAGKSLAASINAAYDKAFSAIFDANITTLITGVVLFWLATDAVRGFAVTLVCGILGTLFSALLVTRVCFRWMTDSKTLKKLNVGKPMRNRGIDFLGMARRAAVASITMVLVSLGTVVFKGNDSLGIDFKGGDLITFQLTPETAIGVPEVEAALRGAGLAKTPVVQTMVTPGSDNPYLSIRVEQEMAAKVVAHLRATVPQFQEKDASGAFLAAESTESVGPTMGKELLATSGLALLVGLLGIFIYLAVQYEFSFSLAAIIALMHDLVITIGLMILLGREMTAVMVGSLLTVAGYSVNDTIIVFDRIRETLKNSGGDIKDVMNAAINATLSRTTLTSLLTLFVLVVMTIFGGPAIQDFSLALVIGIVVGTYSSIFVASAFVFWWTKITGKSLHQEIQEAQVRPSPVIVE